MTKIRIFARSIQPNVERQPRHGKPASPKRNQAGHIETSLKEYLKIQKQLRIFERICYVLAIGLTVFFLLSSCKDGRIDTPGHRALRQEAIRQDKVIREHLIENGTIPAEGKEESGHE